MEDTEALALISAVEKIANALEETNVHLSAIEAAISVM